MPSAIYASQISVAPTADVGAVHQDLAALAITQGIDINMQHEAVSRRIKRLVVFDMDSTLVRQECIDELARLAGKYDQVQVRRRTTRPRCRGAACAEAAGPQALRAACATVRPSPVRRWKAAWISRHRCAWSVRAASPGEGCSSATG